MCCCRDLNRLDNAKSAKATDALLNYETVKYFSNEDLERRNFDKAIQDYQKVEYTLIASLNGLNVLQSLIIWSGMIGGLVVCTKVRDPACPSSCWHPPAFRIFCCPSCVLLLDMCEVGAVLGSLYPCRGHYTHVGVDCTRGGTPVPVLGAQAS